MACDAIIYTDKSSSYKGIKQKHEVVSHGSCEYVRNDVSTNGLEAFWVLFKRDYMGTFHYMREKHLQRYVDEFQVRNNFSRNAVDFINLYSRKFLWPHVDT